MALLENKKQLLIIVVAVGAGIVATMLTSTYVQTKINSVTTSLAEQYEAKQKEVVAQIQQRSEQQMAALAQEINRVKTEQADLVKKQMAALRAQQQAAAAAAAAPKKEEKKPKPSLALKTPEGKRAVTVMIDSLAAVGGLLNAGDNVDVIAQLNVPASSDGPAVSDKDKAPAVTAMIFQNLQVLAVNTNLNEPGAYDDQQAAPSLKVTFAVDPQEAGLLAFADKNGKLELALRHPNDTESQMVRASTWKTLADYVLSNQGPDLLNPDGKEMQEEEPAETKPLIQIFRGGKEL